MAKQVTITIETNASVTLRARTSGREWCQHCRVEGEVLKLEPRNQAENPVWGVLQQLIARNDVHYKLGRDGSAVVCLNSLVALINHRFQTRDCNLRAIHTNMEEI